ncbi:glycosyl hydrolase, partial [Telluria sp. Tellsp131]
HLQAPPPDARPMMRWWWFGPAVVKPELEREILAMKAGGIGGFEIQPVYPMELDDAARGIHNVPYLSPEFLDAVGFANRTGRANGMRVDMTLASGWPYGGPHVTVGEAAARLRQAVVDVPVGAASFPLPVIMNGEKLIAAFIGSGVDPASLTPLQVQAGADGRAAIAPADAPRKVVVYIASRTGQQVKRAALGAEGFVLDHLSRKAVDHHLATVAEPLMKAFGDTPPYAVFSDSLEVYNTDWTDDFAAEFKRRRGYDIVPHLPAVFTGQGPDAPALRRDWALTQTELVNERYLAPIDDWAKKHGTQFRSQTYGEPAVSLSSNRLVALPEGEGPQFREFSFTRLATSAGHLYGRPVISAETWTWLHSPAFAATPLDMKVEADRMLLQGVNQFIGHGWPYTPPGTIEPGYAFYAAAVFNDHNPWWNVMPDVTGYLTRMSWLMRQGEPANQVAVLLPNDDVYAALVPGKVSLSAEMHTHVTPALTAQILDAGQNLDYTDAEAILALGVRHSVLVLPHVMRLAPEVIDKLAAYVRGGGHIVAVGGAPSLAPGYRDAARVSATVAAKAKALFASANVHTVANDDAVGAALRAVLAPDMKLSAQASDVGFVRRRLRDADIYFIANTSNRPVHAQASFAAVRKAGAWIDPDSGRMTAATLPAALDLAPYESRVLVLADALPSAPAPVAASIEIADLGRDWSLRFPGKAQAQRLAALRSWTDDEATRYFSGVATYEKDVELTAAQLRSPRLVLDFGTGTPLESAPKVPAGMRAMFDSPVREAAQVYVNGRRAGAVWHPPYAVDVTGYLRPGRNRIEVRVANLALNALAGHALPDYRLLSARYGQRFVPQDTALIAPQPAGLLGSVKLLGAGQ